MTADEIIKIMQQAKELGLNVKCDGVEISSGSSEVIKKPTIKPEIKEMEASDIVKPISLLDDMSDEEVLMWSSPYYDELVAQKEAHKEAIKNGTTQGES